MKNKNAYDNNRDFINKIFDRSDNPIEELERINSVVPIFFIDENNINYINEGLDKYGYEINPNYISDVKSQCQMYGYPACGGGGYGGHPACGYSSGYGYGGGIGHPACGGGGIGHSSCCSSLNIDKPLLLVKKNNGGIENGIRY